MASFDVSRVGLFSPSTDVVVEGYSRDYKSKKVYGRVYAHVVTPFSSIGVGTLRHYQNITE